MIRVNPKFLAAGAAMLMAGFVMVAYLGHVLPAWQTGMSEDEVAELLVDERQNSDMVVLASMIIGVGFLFVLISFGTARGEGRSKARDLKKPQPPTS